MNEFNSDPYTRELKRKLRFSIEILKDKTFVGGIY